VAYGQYPGPGFGFPVRFRVEVSDDATFSEPRLLAACDEADFPNPGNAPVFLKTPAAKGRFVRLTATRLWPRDDRALLALGEILVLHGELNLAARAPVKVSDAYNNPPAWQPANATDGQTVLGAPVEVMPSPGNGWHAQGAKTSDEVRWVQVDLGQELPLDEVRLFPARPKDFPARRGFGFPVRFRVEAANDETLTEPVMLLDCTQADEVNPAESPVIVPVRNVRARYVRMTATRLWARTNDFTFALAEMQVYSEGKRATPLAVQSSPNAIEAVSWSKRFLVDGFNSQGRIVELAGWLRGLSRRREVEGELQQLGIEQERLTARLAAQWARWTGVLAVCGGAGLAVWLTRRARERRREVEELRQRIASDLHDEIGSNLGSIALLSQIALRQPGDAQSDLTEINRVARETAASMRDIVWLIKPGAATAGDFVTKLRETAATMLAGMDWQLTSEAFAGPLSLELKRQSFLVFKEALHNVRRHASAQRVDIRLADTGNIFLLEIRDDGTGFGKDGSATGHGLASMRQRAKALGGDLSVDSESGRGTRVTLTVRMNALLRQASA
jgi:signal transduction histidine kinase